VIQYSPSLNIRVISSFGVWRIVLSVVSPVRSQEWLLHLHVVYDMHIHCASNRYVLIQERRKRKGFPLYMGMGKQQRPSSHDMHPPNTIFTVIINRLIAMSLVCPLLTTHQTYEKADMIRASTLAATSVIRIRGWTQEAFVAFTTSLHFIAKHTIAAYTTFHTDTLITYIAFLFFVYVINTTIFIAKAALCHHLSFTIILLTRVLRGIHLT
jgi:hypothetical protein